MSRSNVLSQRCIQLLAADILDCWLQSLALALISMHHPPQSSRSVVAAGRHAHSAAECVALPLPCNDSVITVLNNI